MRIVIIGGTGFIGGAISRELVGQGHVVTVVHRGATVVPGTDVIRADRRDIDRPRPQLAANRPDVAIDTILSSGRQTETVFPWLDDQYEKILVERAASTNPLLPATILRLPMVYGPGDPLHRLYPIVKRVDDGRRTIIVARGAAEWRGTRGYVGNVAAAVAAAVVSPHAANRTYNIGESAVPEIEWTRQVARAAGHTGSVVMLPDDRLPPHLVPPGNLAQDWETSSSRLREQLGFRDPVDRETALAETVAWERAHPPAVDPGQFDYDAEDAALAADL